MLNLRERLPNSEQWILGIIPYAIIFYFLFRHGQFMKVVAWLAGLFNEVTALTHIGHRVIFREI
jgi:hypothetical protein